MKKITIILQITLFCSSLVMAQSLDWVKNMGGSVDDIGATLVLDVEGNLYMTGYFVGPADFDPNSGTQNLNGFGNGNADIFVQKFSPNGNSIWVKEMGGSEFDDGQAIGVDGLGNVYTVGRFGGTVDFDPSSNTFNLMGRMFIQKLSKDGDFIWAKSIGLSDSGISVGELTVDLQGNIYITGQYTGTIDFDPNAGVVELTAVGGADIFIQKLSSDGDLIWAKSMGSSDGFEFGYTITVDQTGNIYSSGSFKETADFDPGPAIHHLTSDGFHDIFIQKLDSAGNFLWAKNIGATGIDRGFGITTDHDNNVLITGEFEEIVDFDPGSNLFNLNSFANRDIFILKLDSMGSFIWAKSMGGYGLDRGNSIQVDLSNNIYTSGSFYLAVDFDPSSNIFELNSQWNSGVFIQKMDSNGNFIWAVNFEGLNSSSQLSNPNIVLDTYNNIYTFGSFAGIADFNPTVDSSLLTSNGFHDVFIHKLNHCITNSSEYITACDSFTWINNQTYTSSNFSDSIVLQNAQGCDSIVILNLMIDNPITQIDTIEACESYTWIDGQTYTSSNFSDSIVLQNVQGCDSIVILNLTINNPVTQIDTIEACESYTWIDGQTYTSNNNTTTFILPNVATNGCDSVVQLDLTIDNIDTSVDIGDSILFANQINASYQWLDCSNNFDIILGATSQDFIPTTNGNYAVEIINNNCIDTSTCVEVFVVGIEENSFVKNVHIFPNPSNGLFYIETTMEKTTMDIFDKVGKKVYQSNLLKGKNNINLSLLPSGIYFIELTNEQEKKIFKKIVL